jgi:hypothetical protein
MRYNVHINNVGYNVHIIPWIYYNYPWRISNIFGHLSHEICSHGVPLICIMSKAYPTMHCWSSDQCLEGCKKTPDTGEMDGNGAKKPSTKSTRHSMVLFGASPHKSRIFLHRYIQIHPVVESRATWCLYIYVSMTSPISPFWKPHGVLWWHSPGLMKTWKCPWKCSFL